MSAKSASGAAQEYIVKSPVADDNKTYCMMKFSNVELKTHDIQLKVERENNLKDYKLSHGIDLLPKFGAGSEFGREQKDEARRKKYGIMRKKYNPKEQPMLLDVTDSKHTLKYRGTKEGGIMENASYYIFKQCEDGAFQLLPISEWYNFSKVINYKCLNSEEAEEEFDRRDRTLNYFSIMLKKRVKREEEAADAESGDAAKKKAIKKKNKSKDFNLTDMDEWAILSDGSDESDDSLEEDKKKPAKEKNKKAKTKKQRKKKENSDEEAVEDSDDLDEGQEVDYITDSDSDDEDMYEKKDREDEEKYQEKGVEDEEGLRKLVSSGEEDEEGEEGKEKTDEQDDQESTQDKKRESDSESSSSSDSDSDPEKQANFSSALFMQSKKSDKSKKVSADTSSKNTADKTPSTSDSTSSAKGKKRKTEAMETESNKKEKLELPTSSSSTVITSEGITEEAVKRYLMRKPITIKDLIQKFKSKNIIGLSKEQLVTSIAQILKKLNPDKTNTNDKLYLFIKKPE